MPLPDVDRESDGAGSNVDTIPQEQEVKEADEYEEEVDGDGQ